MHDLPVGTRPAIVPGKTYEYLPTGQPILAAVPDGDARDLLERGGNAFICRRADISEMASVIAKWAGLWRTSTPLPKPREDVLAPTASWAAAEPLIRESEAWRRTRTRLQSRIGAGSRTPAPTHLRRASSPLLVFAIRISS